MSSDNDTQPEIVPIDADSTRSHPHGQRFWAVPCAVAAILLVSAVLVASVLPASLAAENPRGDAARFALVPADTRTVADRISFDAVERFPADGRVLFVTVRVPEITLLDWFVGARQPEVGFLSFEDRFGDQTPDQRRREDVEMMRTAKETAEFVALNHLGFPVEIIPGDVIVAEVICLERSADGARCIEEAPSGELLEPGDKLLRVDGDELATIDDLRPILARHLPGDVIEIEFERPGEGTQTGEVELIGGDDPERTLIGFVPFDTARAELPFEVGIESGEIGGPSAGLAFTLTLIDEMTPGELTGGLRVAVTGSIQIDGEVGRIGGLAQKTSAVRQQGADVFLVPAAQGEEDLARATAVAGDDLEIVAVASLDEALAALAERGGNGLDLGRPGEGFEPAA